MNTIHVILLVAAGLLAGAAIITLILRPRICKLRRKLIADATSGLPNYEGFLAYLKKNRKKDSYDLFLIDLDDFRRFNRRGYDTGDEVLKLFAGRLSEAIEGIAVCARYRLGDEFLVVSRSSDRETIKEMLDELSLNVEYKDDTVSFSYGFSTIEVDDIDGSNAIKTAHAMLTSKKS